jgi:hypothetical protein
LNVLHINRNAVLTHRDNHVLLVVKSIIYFKGNVAFFCAVAC